MQQIEFTSLIFKEGETFVSYCPELGVASCGETVDEARRRLPEAVRLFLEESQRMGTLQDILPCYRAVPVFIILNNLRTAGISRDDYFALLKRA